MTPEEIKTLVEQEAEKVIPMIEYTPNVMPEDKFGYDLSYKEIKKRVERGRKLYIAGATFYEQTVLPKILEEKDEKPWEKLELQSQLLTFGYPYDENDNGRIERVLGWVKAREEEYKEQIQSLRSRLQDVNVEVLIEQNDHLQRKLSQLQSQMEERERKAFEAGFLEARIHLRDPTLTAEEEYGNSTNQTATG